jgi:hypothetical protein
MLAAAAQTTEVAETASLAGTVLSPDGSTPMKRISVAPVANSQAVASTVTVDLGNFKLDTNPGQYDVLIWRNVVQGSRVSNVSLDRGEQIVPPLRVGIHEPELTVIATSREFVAVIRYLVSYFSRIHCGT